jgi:hypothetical protein
MASFSDSEGEDHNDARAQTIQLMKAALMSAKKVRKELKRAAEETESLYKAEMVILKGKIRSLKKSLKREKEEEAEAKAVICSECSCSITSLRWIKQRVESYVSDTSDSEFEDLFYKWKSYSSIQFSTPGTDDDVVCTDCHNEMIKIEERKKKKKEEKKKKEKEKEKKEKEVAAVVEDDDEEEESDESEYDKPKQRFPKPRECLTCDSPSSITKWWYYDSQNRLQSTTSFRDPWTNCYCNTCKESGKIPLRIWQNLAK